MSSFWPTLVPFTHVGIECNQQELIIASIFYLARNIELMLKFQLITHSAQTRVLLSPYPGTSPVASRHLSSPINTLKSISLSFQPNWTQLDSSIRISPTRVPTLRTLCRGSHFLRSRSNHLNWSFINVFKPRRRVHGVPEPSESHFPSIS